MLLIILVEADITFLHAVQTNKNIAPIDIQAFKFQAQSDNNDII